MPCSPARHPSAIATLPPTSARIARELNVRYIVEGSVRRLGERLRITAQLIDTETGSHVWADRFDCETADVFKVQDEVVQTIVGTLVGRVGRLGCGAGAPEAPGESGRL